MAVIVHVANDLQPAVGKTVTRVSMSAHDIGLHCLQDETFLIESHWSLKDKEGQERDRGLGIKIRESSLLFTLVGKALGKIDAWGSFVNLSFNEHSLRVSLVAGSAQFINAGALGGGLSTQKSLRWDPFALTAPGYLIDKKGKKKAPVYRLCGSRKDTNDLSFLHGLLVSRVSWSAEDIGIYFQGQQLLVIALPWTLTDLAGNELDRFLPLNDRQETALFRLIGHPLLSIEKMAAGMRLCFSGGLALTVLFKSPEESGKKGTFKA